MGYSNRTKEQYNNVSKENREEFRQEKRIQELSKKGFNEAAITGMMFGEKGARTGDESIVKSVLKKQRKIILDGNL